MFLAIMFNSNQYEVQNGIVKWDPMLAFPSVHSCILGYQYSINGMDITNVTGNSFRLGCLFTDSETCAMNVLTIRPIVAAGNSILNNVSLTGSACDTGK